MHRGLSESRQGRCIGVWRIGTYLKTHRVDIGGSIDAYDKQLLADLSPSKSLISKP